MKGQSAEADWKRQRYFERNKETDRRRGTGTMRGKQSKIERNREPVIDTLISNNTETGHELHTDHKRHNDSNRETVNE